MKYTIEAVVELLANRHLTGEGQLIEIYRKDPNLYKKAVKKYLLNLSKHPSPITYSPNRFSFSSDLKGGILYESLHLDCDEDTFKQICKNIYPRIQEGILNKPIDKYDISRRYGPIKALIISNKSALTEEDRLLINTCKAMNIYEFAQQYPKFINIEEFYKVLKETKCQEYIEKFENKFLRKENTTNIE